MQPGDMQQSVQQVLVAQIITAAMIGGIVVFLGVVLFLDRQEPQAEPNPILAYVAAGFAVIAVFVRNILPSLIMSNFRKQLARQDSSSSEQSDQLAGMYLTLTIIKNALLEAPAFLVLIIFLIEPYTALPMIAVSLLLIMAFSFPNKSRFDDFIRTQQELLELEQH